MPICPDCGEPTDAADRCQACEAVEAAFTPRGSRAVDPPTKTITFPILVPSTESAAGRGRVSVWIAAAVGVLALVLGAAYALGAVAR